MKYPNLIENFDMYINGETWAGRGLKAKLPVIKMMTGSYRGSGMHGPVSTNQGQEALSIEITLAEWGQGLITGFGQEQSLTMRPAGRVRGFGDAVGWIFTVRGIFTEIDFGDLEAGTDMPMKIKSECDFYKIEREGKQLFLDDRKNGQLISGDTDLNASLHAAMGR